MAKSYTGNAPPAEDGWVLHTKLSGFELWRRPWNEAGWLQLKLVATRRSKKANYWLSWNGNRLAEGKDAPLLLEHHPVVHGGLLALLNANFYR